MNEPSLATRLHVERARSYFYGQGWCLCDLLVVHAANTYFDSYLSLEEYEDRFVMARLDAFAELATAASYRRLRRVSGNTIELVFFGESGFLGSDCRLIKGGFARAQEALVRTVSPGEASG
jgi:hypothetical protein